MADLVVIEYDDEHKALEVRLALFKLQKEYLIEMDDAVVAVKNADGKVKLHQPVNLTAAGAAQGGLLGLVDRIVVPKSPVRCSGRCGSRSRLRCADRHRYQQRLHEEDCRRFQARNLGVIRTRPRGDP